MLRHVFREERVLLMQVCVKTADVSHPCKPLDIHMQWTQFISEEFFLQGDREVRAQTKRTASIRFDDSMLPFCNGAGGEWYGSQCIVQ